MPRPCSICTHPARESVDSELLRAQPYRNIAERFDVSLASLSRHHAGGHVLEDLARTHVAADLASAERLLEEVDGLFAAAKRILASAEEEGESRVALLAIREARATAECLARVGALLPASRPLDESSSAFVAWLVGDGDSPDA